MNLKNIEILSECRDQQEIEQSLKSLGVNLTSEMLDGLKANLNPNNKNCSTLNDNQLDEVAGGVLFLRKVTSNATTSHILSSSYDFQQFSVGNKGLTRYLEDRCNLDPNNLPIIDAKTFDDMQRQGYAGENAISIINAQNLQPEQKFNVILTPGQNPRDEFEVGQLTAFGNHFKPVMS